MLLTLRSTYPNPSNAALKAQWLTTAFDPSNAKSLSALFPRVSLISYWNDARTSLDIADAADTAAMRAALRDGVYSIGGSGWLAGVCGGSFGTRSNNVAPTPAIGAPPPPPSPQVAPSPTPITTRSPSGATSGNQSPSPTFAWSFSEISLPTPATPGLSDLSTNGGDLTRASSTTPAVTAAPASTTTASSVSETESTTELPIIPDFVSGATRLTERVDIVAVAVAAFVVGGAVALIG